MRQASTELHRDYTRTGAVERWIASVSRNPSAVHRSFDALSARCSTILPAVFRFRNQLISETPRLIAVIDEASVIERILRQLRLPTEVPTPRAGAGSPEVRPPVVRFAPCVISFRNLLP